jgi:putative transposase
MHLGSLPDQHGHRHARTPAHPELGNRVIQVLKTPPRAPKANAYAERWVRTVRTECPDWVLVCNRHHLERVLAVYVDHYNTARPHRGIDLDVPVPPADVPPATQRVGRIERVDVLGGLIHEYRHAA